MKFEPLALILNRVERYGSDSDSTLFAELLYAGEFVVKVTTAAFVSLIEDDNDNQRYQLLHRLVRTNSLGDWPQVLDEALIGPASHHIEATLKEEKNVFTERLGKGSWQYEVTRDLHEVLLASTILLKN